MNALTLTEIVADELANCGLSPSEVRSTRAGRRGTDWARDQPGFGVRRYASGRRSYIVQARMGGKLRTVTIANASVISRSMALAVARRVLLRSRTGEDPSESKRKVREIPLYEDFLLEFWTKASIKWKPSTIDRNVHYRAHLEAAFPGVFLDRIQPAEVAGWFANLTSRSGPGSANRALDLLRAMFNRAEAWGLLAEGSNPCSGIRRNRAKRHECLLSSDELARLGQALDAVALSRPMETAAIRLLAFTGCRKGEISNLTWSEVKGRRLLLHDAKTGPRTVWLGDDAVALLSSLPKHPRLPNVFWKGDAALTRWGLDHVFQQVRDRADLSGVRMHDLRHSFASHAAVMSETLPMIGQLLGHSSLRMTSRYAHLDDQSLIEGNEKIGALLAHLMEVGHGIT